MPGRRGPSGKSLQLSRAPSTVARELKRNGSPPIPGYRSVYAHEQARARRWTGARLERDDELRACVLERLSWGWSPEQIARPPGRSGSADGDLLREYLPVHLRPSVRPAQEPRLENLRRAKWKRGRRRRPGSSSAGLIATPQRPVGTHPRRRLTATAFGHWEADTMLFGSRGGGARPARAPLAPRAHRGCLRKRREPIAETSPGCWGHCPLVSQTVAFDNAAGPSSPATTGSSTTSASRPSSATPTRRGEGGSRERHRPAASLPAPEDEPSGGPSGTEGERPSSRRCLGIARQGAPLRDGNSFPLSRE